MADSTPPIEVYGTLAGTIDADASKRVFQNGAVLVNANVRKVHLLIQSLGGFVGDGVGIYNYLRNLPLELVTYNGGQVCSIAVIVYLAGKERQVSEAAAFSAHKSHLTNPNTATAERLKMSAEALLLDDVRSETIFRQYVQLPDEKWRDHERGEMILSASESIEFGLAHRIGDFRPPAGCTLFNI